MTERSWWPRDNMTTHKPDDQTIIFLSTLSHELRTPINGIKGYVDLCLKSDELSSEHREYLEKAKNRTERLNSMVNDLLDLSMMMGPKKIHIYPRWFLLNDFLEDLKNEIIDSKKKDHVEFRFDLLPETGSFKVRTDPDRLRQVLLNLIDNAVKYTMSGYVSLKLRYQKDKMFFFVEDTGIGISKEELDKIFYPFYQSDRKRSRKYSGAGIGLALSKELIERLDGRLMVSSEVGKGSRFIIDMPMESRTLDIVDNLMIDIRDRGC
ncbi:MAG: HAMP domain-containing sensor histidine kinase [Candidatus Thermoplasmatota archaeon]|nr:HAMP domain-containing sensor histidine kinase [Candidatus Thermoplasmatota archaeon]